MSTADRWSTAGRPRGNRGHSTRQGLTAGAIGAVVGGVPSTVHALVTGRDPLEATFAAGTILLPRELRRGRLLAAAALTHFSISLLWGLVLAKLLPRKRPIRAGILAGLAIAALDLGVIGRRLPGVRRLPLGPQLADHVVYGATVGAVLASVEADLRAERVIHATPSQVFVFLSDLRNHWRLEDCFAELESLQDDGEGVPHGGIVQLSGPLRISRTARTRVVEAQPPRGVRPGHLFGVAEIGRGTRGRVRWWIEPHSAGRSHVSLSAVLQRASVIDRVLFIVGRPWLQRTFRRVLANLDRALNPVRR